MRRKADVRRVAPPPRSWPVACSASWRDPSPRPIPCRFAADSHAGRLRPIWIALPISPPTTAGLTGPRAHRGTALALLRSAGGSGALDTIAQISAFVKLKLTNCARLQVSCRAFLSVGDHICGYLFFARIHCCLQWRGRSGREPRPRPRRRPAHIGRQAIVLHANGRCRHPTTIPRLNVAPSRPPELRGARRRHAGASTRYHGTVRRRAR